MFDMLDPFGNRNKICFQHHLRTVVTRADKLFGDLG